MIFRKRKSEDVVEKVDDFPTPTDIDGFEIFMKDIKALAGVDLEPKRDIILQRIGLFAKNNKIKSFKEVANIMRANATLRQDVLNIITVNETYFYRELAQLQDAIDFAKTRNNTRILCAPCSTGDEVYSLAMLANESGIDKNKISIHGIDINSKAINLAKDGVFSERSLHRLNENQKKVFFNKQDEKYKVRKLSLCNCDFSVVNVFDDELLRLGKFDVILSRNMMIYFDDNFRKKCIENFSSILKDDGRIYTGHADFVPHTDMYKKVFSHGVSFYEKA